MLFVAIAPVNCSDQTLFWLNLYGILHCMMETLVWLNLY